MSVYRIVSLHTQVLNNLPNPIQFPVLPTKIF